MTDILDDSFAVILLTRAELDGPLCRSPDALMARALSSHAAPHWLEVGSRRALFDGQLGNAFDRKAADPFLYKIFGVVPGARLDCSRSRKWSPRATDPNAGKAPEDPFFRREAVQLRRRHREGRESSQTFLDGGPCA
jgi:hypothetical protein